MSSGGIGHGTGTGRTVRVQGAYPRPTSVVSSSLCFGAQMGLRSFNGDVIVHDPIGGLVGQRSLLSWVQRLHGRFPEACHLQRRWSTDHAGGREMQISLRLAPVRGFCMGGLIFRAAAGGRYDDQTNLGRREAAENVTSEDPR
jgi:hypothetical protein